MGWTMRGACVEMSVRMWAGLLLGGATLAALSVFVAGAGGQKDVAPYIAESNRDVSGGKDSLVSHDRDVNRHVVPSLIQWQSINGNFSELLRSAEGGDITAQREIAKIYARCFSASLSSANYRSTASSFASGMSTPLQSELFRRAAEARFEECAGVDDGEPIPVDAVQFWTRQAAEGGDLEALVIAGLQFSDETVDESLLWDRVIAEGNGAALYLMADLAGSPEFARRFGGFVDQDDARLVTSMVACELGLDCGSGSRLMMSLCVDRLQCSNGSYEEWAMDTQVASSRRGEIRAQVQKLLPYFRGQKGVGR